MYGPSAAQMIQSETGERVGSEMMEDAPLAKKKKSEEKKGPEPPIPSMSKLPAGEKVEKIHMWAKLLRGKGHVRAGGAF